MEASFQHTDITTKDFGKPHKFWGCLRDSFKLGMRFLVTMMLMDLFSKRRPNETFNISIKSTQNKQ